MSTGSQQIILSHRVKMSNKGRGGGWIVTIIYTFLYNVRPSRPLCRSRSLGWMPCLMPLTLRQLPARRTRLLWRGATALIQFYSPSTPAHKCCKPIRPALFISPLRAISLPNLEWNQPSFFPFFLSLKLPDTLSPFLSIYINLFLSLHPEMYLYQVTLAPS